MISHTHAHRSNLATRFRRFFGLFATLIFALALNGTCENSRNENSRNNTGNTTANPLQCSVGDQFTCSFDSEQDCNVDVTLNAADSIVPLAAMARFKTANGVQVQVSVDSKTGGTHPIVSSGSSSLRTTEHCVPILGLHPDNVNSVTITITDRLDSTRQRVSTHDLTTTAIPTAALIPTLTRTLPPSSSSTSERRLFYVGGNGANYAIDANGDVRWYLADAAYILYRQLRSGNLIVGTGERAMNVPLSGGNTESAPPYYHNRIQEIDLLGRVVRSHAIANHVHHAVIENSIGTTPGLLVATSNHDTNGVADGEDLVIKLNRQTGQQIFTFDYASLLSSQRPRAISGRPDDWAHINGLALASNGSLVASIRQQSAIANVSINSYLTATPTQTVEWILGDSRCWNLGGKDLSGKVLMPKTSGDADKLPSGQHSVSFSNAGNLLVFDNGTNRGVYAPGMGCNTNASTNVNNPNRIREYAIDTTSNPKTYSLAWEYELSTNHQSFRLGNVSQLSSGNYLAYFPPIGTATATVVEILRNDSGTDSKVLEFEFDSSNPVAIFHTFPLSFDFYKQ